LINIREEAAVIRERQEARRVAAQPQ
jgi:hypothetical protein